MDQDEKQQKIKEDICTYLREGLYKKDAAKMAGISEDTYLRWYKEDADFAGRVEASILAYKRSLIQNISIAAESNPSVALQILKIRWANDWAKPQPEDTPKPSDTKLIADMLQTIFHQDHEIERLKTALGEPFEESEVLQSVPDIYKEGYIV